MRRRRFLQLGLVAGGAFLVPRNSRGGSSGGPLLIHIQAGGGWDPTLLCDPRPEVNDIAFGVAETTTSSGTLRFADLGGPNGPSFPRNTGYAFRSFFDTWAEDLLILNGVYTHGVGHRSGGRYASSGRISDGYPALAALVAATTGADLAMPLIVSSDGGYAKTGGHVAPTRLSTSQFLDAIAWPNIYANGSQDYYAQDELAALEAAKQARLDRLIAGEGRAADRAALERLQTAHLRHSDLGLLVSAIDEGPNTTLPAPTNSNRTAIHVFEDGFASLLAYEQGLCRASILQGGSFDTHVDHDSSHPNQLQCLIQAIDLLMQEAISRALPVVFLVTSEFGRTSGYNVADGKDHWPVTSWMMLQTPGLNLFQGGREVGATILDPTTGVTVYRDLDITSLAVGDPAGESPLTPELLHVGLRRLLNIDTHPLADHNYPLPGPDVSRLFSG